MLRRERQAGWTGLRILVLGFLVGLIPRWGVAGETSGGRIIYANAGAEGAGTTEQVGRTPSPTYRMRSTTWYGLTSTVGHAT